MSDALPFIMRATDQEHLLIAFKHLPKDVAVEIGKYYPLLIPPFTNATLRRAVQDYVAGGFRKLQIIEKYGEINNWNTSKVTNMSRLFDHAKYFNDEIDNWDVSNVTKMTRMFMGAKSFNQSLNSWNVSKVTDMGSMFCGAKSFNQPLHNWDVSNVTHMGSYIMEDEDLPYEEDIFYNLDSLSFCGGRRCFGMFEQAISFNQPLNNWDVSNVKNMNSMFRNAQSFNQPLNLWKDKVSNVRTMSSMFEAAISFDQSLNNWDVSRVKLMDRMFCGAISFNKPLNNWITTNVLDMRAMFENAHSFNQSINDWDVSDVYFLMHMFCGAKSFNQPLNKWIVSKVGNMERMFCNATSFNQPLDNWNVSCVYNMTAMFDGATSFNQPLNDWIVSNVECMQFMFMGATSFNQPLEKWDVSKVRNTGWMFKDATSFNQHVDNWFALRRGFYKTLLKWMSDPNLIDAHKRLLSKKNSDSDHYSASSNSFPDSDLNPRDQWYSHDADADSIGDYSFTDFMESEADIDEDFHNNNYLSTLGTRLTDCDEINALLTLPPPYSAFEICNILERRMMLTTAPVLRLRRQDLVAVDMSVMFGGSTTRATWRKNSMQLYFSSA